MVVFSRQQTREYCVAEHETVAKKKVREGAHRDCPEIGREVVDSELPDQQPHQQKVAGNGDGPVAQVEFKQPYERLHGPLRRSVRPGKALVPQKVVQHSGLDSKSGCQKVVQAKQRVEDRQGRQLHSDADPADEIELQPTHQQFPPFVNLLSFVVSGFVLNRQRHEETRRNS